MKLWITGATGFVGGYAVEAALARGDQVQGWAGRGRWPEDLGHLDGQVPLEPLDLTAPETTNDLIRRLQQDRPEAILHLAAQSNPRASFDDPPATWRINLGGTLALLEAMRKAAPLSWQAGSSSHLHWPRLVVVSSGMCYGRPEPPDRPPFGPNDPPAPRDPYSASKAAADLAALQYHHAHGFDVVIARPFQQTGPRQSERYVLSGMARQVAEVEAGMRSEVSVGNLEVERDFTDVRDMVRAYLRLTRHAVSGRIVVLGRGRGIKLADALDHLRGLADRPIPVRIDPARLRNDDPPRILGDPQALHEALGDQPLIPIETTLADLLNWWRGRIRGSQSRPSDIAS